MTNPYPKITVRETHDPMAEIVQSNPDAFAIMSAQGVHVVPQTPSEEEELITLQDPTISSGLFAPTRAEFIPHFRAMLAPVFDEFGISTKEGLDVGSGKTGAMVHQILPLRGEERKTWTECELNPGAVAMHRSTHLSARLMQGSYLRLRESLNLPAPVDTITGLSSLDATNHLALAVKEIRDALSLGGYLVHMQDVRPGVHNGVSELELRGWGNRFSFLIGITGPHLPNQVPNPFGYVLEEGNRDGIVVVSSIEVFRQSLNRTIQSTPGLELVYSTWLEATSPNPQGDQFSQYFECMVTHDPSAKEKKAYAVVTVARRSS